MVLLYDSLNLVSVSLGNHRTLNKISRKTIPFVGFCVYFNSFAVALIFL